MFKAVRLHILVLPAALLLLPTMAQGAGFDESLRDPTLPLNFSGQDGDGFNVSMFDELQMAITRYHLNSVMIRSQDRFAVINDERVRIGDTIGAAVVIAIEANSATLEMDDGKTSVLQLYDGSVKTRVVGEAK